MGRSALLVAYGGDPDAFAADEARGWSELDGFWLTAEVGRETVASWVRLHLGWSGDLDLPTEWVGEALGHLPHPLDATLLEAWNRRRLRVDGEGIARRPRTDPEFKTLRRGYVRSAGPRATIRRGAWRHVTARAHESRRALATRQRAGWALSEGYATAPLVRLWEVTDGDRAELVEFFEEHRDRTETGGRLVREWFGSSDSMEPPERRIRSAERRLDALRDEVEGIAGALRGRPAAEKQVRNAVHRFDQARTSLRAAHAQVDLSGRERAASAAKASPPAATTRAGPWRGGVMIGLALLAVLASGCPVEPSPDTDPDDTGTPCEETSFHLDADGDGYGDPSVEVEACEAPEGYVADGTDCDDADHRTHPGADESCTQAVDRNCDGSVLYEDADGDGSAACRDCDDASADIFPGADERCDGVDEDCDGEVDEDALDMSTWLVDADGDGYGAEVLACEAPAAPEVETDGDCDDDDPMVNPEGEDVCDDGIDQDCDGFRAYCKLEGEVDIGATPIVVVGEAELDVFGSGASATDVDQDGQDDLLVTAPYSDRGGTDCGATYLFNGPLDGVRYAEDADHMIVGDCSTTSFGSTTTGDVDADGLPDLLARADSSVLVFYGPLQRVNSQGDADLAISGDPESSSVGFKLGGDFDGDGLPELVFRDRTSVPNDGRVFLLPNPTTGATSIEDATAWYSLDLEGSVCDAGSSIVADLDFDGDGHLDLVMDRGCGSYGDGMVQLFLGPLSGELLDGDAEATITEGIVKTGRTHAVDDLEEDGLPELVVGNLWSRGPSSTEVVGAVHFYFSPISGSLGPSDAARSVYGSEEFCAIGAEHAALDLDGDGLLDLVTDYTPSYCFSGNATHAAGLFYGADELWGSTFEEASLTLVASEAVGRLKRGDLDGDGVDDLIVGLSTWSYRNKNDGVVFVVTGRTR